MSRLVPLNAFPACYDYGTDFKKRTLLRTAEYFVPNAGSAPWMTETGSNIFKGQLRKARIGGSRDNTFVRKEFTDYVRGRNFPSTIPDPEEVTHVRRPTANTPVDVINAAVDIVKAAIDGAMDKSQKISQLTDAADDEVETHVAEDANVSQGRQAGNEASPSAPASPPTSSPLPPAHPQIAQEPTTTTEITKASLDNEFNHNRLSAKQSEADLMTLLSPVPGHISTSTLPSVAPHPSLNVERASHLSFNSIRAEMRVRKSSEKTKPNQASQRVRIGKNTETTEVNFNHQMHDEWRLRMKGMINKRSGFDFKTSNEWNVYERYA